MRLDKTMYKAIISDLDGTLLDDSGKLSKRTVRVINALNDSGVKIIIATGRLDVDARAALVDLSFSPVIVSCNGAVVKGGEDAPLWVFDLFSRELKAEVVSHAGDLKLHVTIFSEREYHMMERNPAYDGRLNTEGMLSIHKNIDSLVEVRALKILLHGADEHINDCCTEIFNRYGKDANVCKSTSNTIEIMAHGVDKFYSASKYLAEIGIGPEDVISFGDAMNDYILLSNSGHGVMMGNAIPDLKRALPNHPCALSNAQDGVAKYLESMFDI